MNGTVTCSSAIKGGSAGAINFLWIFIQNRISSTTGVFG